MRSRENVPISLQNISSVYIRAAPLIIQKCDLALNTHAIFFPNDNDSATSIATGSHGECQWSVRSMFYESEGRPSSCFRCGRGHSLMWPAIKHAPLTLRPGRYDDMYRMDEIKSLSFHIMFYRLYRDVAKYIVYGYTCSSFEWLIFIRRYVTGDRTRTWPGARY